VTRIGIGHSGGLGLGMGGVRLAGGGVTYLFDAKWS